MSLVLLCACESPEQPHQAPVQPISGTTEAPTAEAEAKTVEPIAAAEPTEGELVAQARAKTVELGGALKSHLMGAMKDGGPVAAIGACNESAPKVSTEVSTDGWSVGRTAQKLRNPDNTPDAWETAVLQDFERRIASGEQAGTLESHAIVEEEGKRRFRYMKAIPTGAKCLLCHGKEIEPTLAAKLEALYPADAARGFSEGELRGAFTLSKEL